MPHYQLLLNESLKTHIQGLGVQEKQRLREKLEFLEAGIWDSGLRVKKLKNPGHKVVFEARVSKSERLLFTLGKRGDRTVVYLWGLVGHDDVSQAACSVLPDNAPFLNFEPDAVEDYPEALLDDLPADYFRQDSVEDHTPDEHGPQKWLILNDRQWQRLLQASASGNLEIYLFLTPEQAEILKTPPPLLLSGTAGSGKTTISVYYLLRKAFRDKKRLFLTFSPFLRDFSERIYAGLVAKTSREEAAPPSFRVFRELLQEIVGSAGHTYAAEKEVGFREFQDFADIQLALIFNLVPSPANIVLTGDPKQIINPSGFRWEEVRNKFYERGVAVPDVRHLSMNFRCVGSIVRLANALLELKRRLVGLSGSELREEWKFSGRPPFVLSGLAETDILERMQLKGAGRIVLVRDRREQKRLKAALGSELVFTIHEAKGLEFDTVFLWKFAGGGDSRDLWRAIREGGEFDRSHQPHVRHELNLLYVAVTRARNALIIYDAGEDVWTHPLLNEHLYRTAEKEVLSEVWQRVSTPAEWARQGDYFFERQYYFF